MRSFFFRQIELLDKEFLTEAQNLDNIYTSARAENAHCSTTDIDLQRKVCREIDNFYHEVITNKTESKKSEFTKNLVKARLDIMNGFIKNKLLSPVKECPHCQSVKRKVR